MTGGVSWGRDHREREEGRKGWVLPEDSKWRVAKEGSKADPSSYKGAIHNTRLSTATGHERGEALGTCYVLATLLGGTRTRPERSALAGEANIQAPLFPAGPDPKLDCTRLDLFLPRLSGPVHKEEDAGRF